MHLLPEDVSPGMSNGRPQVPVCGCLLPQALVAAADRIGPE